MNIKIYKNVHILLYFKHFKLLLKVIKLLNILNIHITFYTLTNEKVINPKQKIISNFQNIKIESAFV